MKPIPAPTPAAPTKISLAWLFGLMLCVGARADPASDYLQASGQEKLVICSAAHRVLSERMLEDYEVAGKFSDVPGNWALYLTFHAVSVAELELAKQRSGGQGAEGLFDEKASAYRQLVPRMDATTRPLFGLHERFCKPEFNRMVKAGDYSQQMLEDIDAREKPILEARLKAATEKGVKARDARRAQ